MTADTPVTEASGADTGEPGEQPGADDAATLSAPGAEEAVALAPQADPVTDYLDAIERAEALNSAYSSELADLYLGLGQHHLERQELEEARKAFLRGMQITRVNNGLHSTQQTPYMFSIADIESRMGELGTAEAIMKNIYSINAKTLGHDHPDMLPVLSQMLNWYQTRTHMYGPGSRYANMVKAERITNEMASIIEEVNGLAHPETARIYRRVGQLNFYLAEQLSRYGHDDQPVISFSSGYDARPGGVPPSVKTHFSQGRDAFEKFAESVNLDAGRSPLDRADALAQLGDWYLVFDKPQTASTAYQRAFNVLQDSSDDEQLTDRYFGQPKPLDFMDVKQYNPAVQKQLAGEPLEVKMTITRAGRVRDLEILNMPGHLEKDQVRMVQKELNGLRFRPRLNGGLPENTEQFVWQYPAIPGEVAP